MCMWNDLITIFNFVKCVTLNFFSLYKYIYIFFFFTIECNIIYWWKINTFLLSSTATFQPRLSQSVSAILTSLRSQFTTYWHQLEKIIELHKNIFLCGLVCVKMPVNIFIVTWKSQNNLKYGDHPVDCFALNIHHKFQDYKSALGHVDLYFICICNQTYKSWMY